MKSTTINPYDHVGIWKQRSRLFERLYVLIFGVCHINARSVVQRVQVDEGWNLEAEDQHRG